MLLKRTLSGVIRIRVTIDLSDIHHLRAAEGWLELGDTEEAEAELGLITPAMRELPNVLELRWQICAKAKKWEVCLDIAAKLVKACPERPSAWIHRAFSLRRAPGGGLKIAFDALLPAAGKFPTLSVIPFNLACYCCQMGDLPEARNWLQKALANEDAKEVKQMALTDPDLEPLHSEIAEQ